MKKYVVLFLILVLIIIVFAVLVRKDKREEDPGLNQQKREDTGRNRHPRISEEDSKRLEKLGLAVKNIRNLPFEIHNDRKKEGDVQGRGNLVGIVMDSDREPLKGCILTLRNKDEPFTSARRTDLSGKFFFENIKTGEYKLVIQCEAGKAERGGIIVEKDKVNNLEILLEKKEVVPVSVISGNVIDFVNRTPVQGASVRFTGRKESSSEIATDDLGRFSINVTSPQNGRIVIDKEGYVRKSIEVEITEKEVHMNNIPIVKGNIKDEGQKYQGIGAALIEKNNEFVVAQVFEDSPAAKAGLKNNDRIYQINGMDLSSLGLSEVIALIRGDERTNVILTVKRGDETKYIQIVRDVIEIKESAGKRVGA